MAVGTEKGSIPSHEELSRTQVFVFQAKEPLIHSRTLEGVGGLAE